MAGEVIVAPDPEAPRARRAPRRPKRSEAEQELLRTMRGFLQYGGHVEVELHADDDEDLDAHVAREFEAYPWGTLLLEVVRLDLVESHGRRWHCLVPTDRQTAAQCQDDRSKQPRGTPYGKREALLHGLLAQVHALFWEQAYLDLPPPPPVRRRDARGRFLPGRLSAF